MRLLSFPIALVLAVTAAGSIVLVDRAPPARASEPSAPLPYLTGDPSVPAASTVKFPADSGEMAPTF